MRDLAREFFERDLDDAEWRELGRQLEADDAVKDRFLESAAGYYQALGLPEPGLGAWQGWGGALGGWSGLALGIVLGAAGGAMAVWALRPEAATAPPPAQAEAAHQATPVPAAPPPARTAPKPEPGPTLAPPPDKGAPAREASPGFPGLAAVVELSRQGLVTARVLDAQGREQRLLFAGILDAGRWSFGWDGQDEVARPVQPGTYTIEVQEGSRILRRSVLVQAKPGGAQP
jgi:hypothetical protein